MTTRRLAWLAAAAGFGNGLLIYVVRVLSRELLERDIYLIGWGLILPGLALAGLAARRSRAGRWRRGLLVFLIYQATGILGGSLALIYVVESDTAGF